MKTNRNVHASGALGRLINSGQISKVNEDNSPTLTSNFKGLNRISNNQFRTQTGIEFKENELLYIDPQECEPWQYANRQDAEMADIQDLMESIQNNQQLQPGLVRLHPAPHDKIKYEIIFGRRRHLACLKLGIPFLVIKKDLTDIQDAVLTQDAENKERKDVSNYSNAVLYKRLIIDGIFKTEKELATKLGISPSSLSELLAFTRIPSDLIAKIPNVHEISTAMALKIVSILSSADQNHKKLLQVAPLIGTQLTSPVKLDAALKALDAPKASHSSIKPISISASNGKKLFTLKVDSKGTPTLSFDKNVKDKVNYESICALLKEYLEKHLL